MTLRIQCSDQTTLASGEAAKRRLSSSPDLRGVECSVVSAMQNSDFLERLEHHLATRLSGLDVKAHPSSDSPCRLTRQWTIDFLAAEAAKHPEFANLAALLRNVRETGPEFSA